MADAEDDAQEELSLSVEATNTLRAKLGLAPLRMTDAKEDAANEKHADEKAQHREDVAAVELEQKIAAARRKRQLRQGVAGQSVAERLAAARGESGGGSSVVDVSSWVARSRTVGDDERKLAAKRAAELNAQDDAGDYGEEHLAGLGVAHAEDSIRDGSSVIMTLKDSSILEAGQDGEFAANEGADMLENANLAESDRTSERQEKSKKSARSKYDATDAAEFESGVTGPVRNVLAHYDDYEVDGAGGESKQKTFTLGASGQLADKKAERLAAVRARLAGSGERATGEAAPMAKQSLTDVPHAMQSSNYYTTEEMSSFKKPKRRKKKVQRTKAKGSLADELTPAESREDDAGSRSRDGGAKYAREAAESGRSEAAKSAAYRTAYDRALQQQETGAGGLLVDEGEDGAALASSLALSQAPRGKEEWSAVQQGAEADFSAMDSDAPAAIEGVSFTATTEFCSAVGQASFERKRVVTEQREQAAAAAPPAVADGSPEDAAMQEEALAAAMAEDEAKNAPEVSASAPVEATMGSGMAGALQAMRSKGMLQDDQEEYQVGRTNDYKLQKSLEQMEAGIDGPDGYEHGNIRTQGLQRDVALKIAQKEEMMRKRQIKDIVYADEDGMSLTSKEAFRQMCHQFHGIEPSKAKMEKRQKMVAEREALKAEAGGLKSTAAMKKQQASSGKAYVSLDAQAVHVDHLAKRKDERPTRKPTQKAKRPRREKEGRADRVPQKRPYEAPSRR